ncbi:MAG TPA: hypothetical protein ENK57_06405 [Polyangiaceae bacterium]|nr:hypothetical protein [Polyangiaceae bacterium]
MTPMAAIYVLSLAIVMLAVLVGAALIAARKQRVVCPENGQAVDVSCDPRGAVKTVFAGGHLRVSDCERWPEMAGCDRACEKQLQR